MSERTLTSAHVAREEEEQVQAPLGWFEQWANRPALRKAFILILLGLAWQGYAVYLDNPLIFPSLSDTLQAFWDGIVSGGLVLRAGFSLRLLLAGYAAGVAIAGVVTAIAVTSRFGNDLLETLTAMFNPLPPIALLPIALIWFGLGSGSLIFVLIHAVLWPIALNMHSGFRSVSTTLRMVGRNYGLSGPAFVLRILIPAAFPAILSGLKIGWAFAWRTLIAAELVFGVSSGSGGLGWFIYENKNQLEIPSVFAGLLTVVLIGLAVENLVFRTLENRTVRRWGMHN
jgi:NitT/TauT family transport system permease protein